MFEYESTVRRGARPPVGFDVMRTIDLDPEQDREDRWLFHGRVHGRNYIRAEFKSRADACRAAWVTSGAVHASDVGTVVQGARLVASVTRLSA
jgi:hypothetical protein